MQPPPGCWTPKVRVATAEKSPSYIGTAKLAVIVRVSPGAMFRGTSTSSPLVPVNPSSSVSPSKTISNRVTSRSSSLVNTTLCSSNPTAPAGWTPQDTELGSTVMAGA